MYISKLIENDEYRILFVLYMNGCMLTMNKSSMTKMYNKLILNEVSGLSRCVCGCGGLNLQTLQVAKICVICPRVTRGQHCSTRHCISTVNIYHRGDLWENRHACKMYKTLLKQVFNGLSPDLELCNSCKAKGRFIKS